MTAPGQHPPHLASTQRCKCNKNWRAGMESWCGIAQSDRSSASAASISPGGGGWETQTIRQQLLHERCVHHHHRCTLPRSTISAQLPFPHACHRDLVHPPYKSTTHLSLQAPASGGRGKGSREVWPVRLGPLLITHDFWSATGTLQLTLLTLQADGGKGGRRVCRGCLRGGHPSAGKSERAREGVK